MINSIDSASRKGNPRERLSRFLGDSDRTRRFRFLFGSSSNGRARGVFFNNLRRSLSARRNSDRRDALTRTLDQLGWRFACIAVVGKRINEIVLISHVSCSNSKNSTHNLSHFVSSAKKLELGKKTEPKAKKRNQGVKRAIEKIDLLLTNLKKNDRHNLVE